MERELPRTSLNGSALVGLLAQLALIDGPATPPSFVQGLGRWLGWEDAIKLSGALPGPGHASPGLSSPVRAGKLAAQLQRDLQRLRTALARTLQQDGTQAGDTDFAPYRQHYLAQQQAMADGVGPLRAQARAAVALMSPAMHRLAALDEVMDTALGSQERRLLAALPALLEKHFTRLQQAHGQAHEATDTDTTSHNTGWLHTFRQDMQRMAQAELELRLLPLQGLLDTLQTLPPPKQQAHRDT